MDLTAVKSFIRTALDSYWVLPIFWIFAWVLMLLTGNGLIRWLKSLKGMKWSPREDTPDSHLQKAGIPSMGGIGILGAATLSWVASLIISFSLSCWSPLPGVGLTLPLSPGIVPSFWNWVVLCTPLLCVLAHGVLGFADDWSKARGKGGLTSKAKLAGQIVLAVLFLCLIRLPVLNLPYYDTTKWLLFDWRTWIVCALILIGTSNAVNLTDGIDGLAAGLSVQVGVVFGMSLFLYMGDKIGSIFPTSMSFVWLALGGGCLGFLAFNKNPAKVFMGDTGSLALGAGLGLSAILTRSVFLLPFIGFIFYVEMFSVIAQVAYFKYTKKRTGEGKRIFRRAPLHHHFELGGWSEWHVVLTFWTINALTTIIGLVLWLMDILPRFP